jgi:type VI secretion system secreted protein VgrG
MLDLTGQDLGGLTLTPGVYKFDSSAQLTGQLTLNLLGDPNSLFVFQIGSTLTTASNSSVITSNGAECCNIYWQVGSSATLGTTTDFLGNILADQSITLTTGADIIDGRALALNGAVTLDDNNISNAGCAVPEPGTAGFLGAGLFGLFLFGRTSRKRTA